MEAMRLFVVVCCVSFATITWADKKIVDMTPGFERELSACETQVSGVSSMLARAKTFVATNPPDKADIDKSIERLALGHDALQAYCGEVRAMVALLKEHANAAYKAVEKAIDERDNSVRKARRDGKKWIEELAPITRKLIPRVTARVRQIDEKKTPGKFPSGRTIELPALDGAWKLGGNAVTDLAEYTTKTVTATITARPFTNATCDQQKKQFAAKAGDEPIAELELSPAAKSLGVAWASRYVRRDQTPHVLAMMCLTAGTGGFVALADITPPQDALADELAKVMVTMLVAQAKKS
jgi:hypothetical protein